MVTNKQIFTDKKRIPKLFTNQLIPLTQFLKIRIRMEHKSTYKYIEHTTIHFIITKCLFDFST